MRRIWLAAGWSAWEVRHWPAASPGSLEQLASQRRPKRQDGRPRWRHSSHLKAKAERRCRVSGRRDFARFQSDAETACQCARRSPDRKTTWWAKFQLEIVPYPHSEDVSMCDPIAPTSTCFEAVEGACVVTEYSQVPGASFCTPSEARAAMAVYREADNKRIRGRGKETGEQALVRFSHALATGQRVPSSGLPGCGG